MNLTGFYNMDCMEGMKYIPDKYFELAILFLDLKAEVEHE